MFGCVLSAVRSLEMWLRIELTEVVFVGLRGCFGGLARCLAVLERERLAAVVSADAVVESPVSSASLIALPTAICSCAAR